MAAGEDLGYHGDVAAAPGLVDLAVNVRSDPMPSWLADQIAASLHDLARYPDAAPAHAAVARRQGRPADEVLLTAGAAQGFVLLAQALRDARRSVVVHPQFTEPEAALLAAGHRVQRVVLPALADWLRVAVRDTATTDRFVATLADLLRGRD